MTFVVATSCSDQREKPTTKLSAEDRVILFCVASGIVHVGGLLVCDTTASERAPGEFWQRRHS
jgi:hypothetical protein